MNLETLFLLITVVLSAVNLWGKQIKSYALMAYGYALLIIGFFAVTFLVLIGKTPFGDRT